LNPEKQLIFAHEILAFMQQDSPVLLNAIKQTPVLCQAILLYHLRDFQSLTNDFKYFDLLKLCIPNFTSGLFDLISMRPSDRYIIIRLVRFIALAEGDDRYSKLKELMIINLLRSCVSCRIHSMFENIADHPYEADQI
jgi:hypothetical protein